MGTKGNVTVNTGGELYVAELDAAEPASASAAVPAGYRSLGYTESGVEITYQAKVEKVRVNELTGAVHTYTDEIDVKAAVELAEGTKNNLSIVLNGGIVDGEPADAAFEPPAPGEEKRVKLLYVASNGAKWVLRECTQVGAVKIGGKRGEKRNLPAEFELLEPATGLKPFRVLPNAAGLI